MKASDIPDGEILDFIRDCNEGRVPDHHGRLEPRWCQRWDLEARFHDFPPKVILAKCRGLIKRGLLEGCECGCRGDFNVDGTPVSWASWGKL